MIEDVFIYTVAGLIGLAILIAILRQPYLGVAFTLATLPVIGLFPSIPFFSSIALPLGLVTLASYLLQLKDLHKRRKRQLDPVYLLGLVFIFWIMISNPEAAFLGEGRVWFFTFAQLWILMLLSGELLVTPQRQRSAMLIFALAAMISAIFAIIRGEIAEDAVSSARVTGLATNANEAARYFVIALVFFYYLRTKTDSAWLKVFYLIGIFITFFGVFFTVSRSGILLLFGAFGLILIFQPQVKNKVSLIVLMVVGLIALSFFSDSIFQIIRDIFPAIQEGTDTVGLRYNLWRAGWKMWLDHPLTGVGIGQYNYTLWRYMIGMEGPTVGSTTPHNTYVQVLSETGIVGFSLFIGLLFRAFRNLWLSPSRLNSDDESARNIWLIVILVISVGGITTTDLANKIFWMILGVSVVFSNKIAIEQKDTISAEIANPKTSASSIRLRRWMKNAK